MKEGQRTPRFKASLEAFKNNDFQLGNEFSMPTETTGYSSSSALLTTLTQNASSSAVDSPSGRKSKNKSSSQQSPSSSSSSSLSPCSHHQLLYKKCQQTTVVPESDSSSQVDGTCDPNEPPYCVCNQVSSGEMGGCDNHDCPMQWFHYGCAGWTEAPKGKWYRPLCTAARKRKGGRHE
ncbi:Inhibitor of growth protein 3 [Manis javanica]|nr:Inhibitor of growth protein 3 [Manis javanica]